MVFSIYPSPGQIYFQLSVSINRFNSLPFSNLNRETLSHSEVLNCHHKYAWNWCSIRIRWKLSMLKGKNLSEYENHRKPSNLNRFAADVYVCVFMNCKWKWTRMELHELKIKWSRTIGQKRSGKLISVSINSIESFICYIMAFALNLSFCAFQFWNVAAKINWKTVDERSNKWNQNGKIV